MPQMCSLNERSVKESSLNIIVKCISDCDTWISDIERGNILSMVVRRWSRINRVSAARIECASSVNIFFITAAS